MPEIEHQSKQSFRRICFVTGTRAEFGLMRSTLEAIQKHPALELQIVATGMHLSSKHGKTIQTIRAEGWKVDATVPWAASKSTAPTFKAVQTGRAMAGIAAALQRLSSDIVLVVGDRVEAFAAAAAAHVAGLVVAHVHGGDRALGQVDDSLRHAITKLAHLHFPATVQSQKRILKLGENPKHVFRVGSPGIDDIATDAASPSKIADYVTGIKSRAFALLVLHPTDTDESAEAERAKLLLDAARRIGFEQIVIVYPNNDPGSNGIIRCWEQSTQHAVICRDLPRSVFLGLLRDAAVLLGNSSSGIIEAASFGTPVLNVGPRQMGREHSKNLTHVRFSKSHIERELRRIWNHGSPLRCPKTNVYGGYRTDRRIAQVLAAVSIDNKLRRKLIIY